MTIAFQNIPGNIRVPFFYGEVRAGSQGYQQNAVLLLIGYKNTSPVANIGSAADNVPVQVFGNEDKLFGIDSPLAQMVKIARKNAPFQTIWGLPIAYPGSPTAATSSFTVSGAATRSATSALYINGVQEQFTIVSGDTATQIAAKIVAAVNADVNCPVTAGNTAGAVTLTANVSGTWGNTLKLAVNLYPDDDPYFSSLITLSAFASGAGDPNLTAGLANLGDMPFDYVATMFSDSANLALLENFFNDVSGRWGPYSQVYGHGFWGKDESPSSLATDGLLHNSQHMTFFGSYNYLTPPYLSVAARAAICASQLSTFPAGSAPLQTLPVLGVIGPQNPGDRPTIQERQSLYFDGVSMDRIDPLTGEVQLDRVLTTYQHNAYGSPDQTFLDINTIAQVQYCQRRFKADMEANLGRKALADTNPYNVSNIATPDDVKHQLIHTYTSLAKDGVVENVDVFAANIECERDQNDPNRVNATLPIDTVNQLVIVATATIVYLQDAQGS